MTSGADPERGDRVDELLRYVHFDPQELLARLSERMAAAALEPDVSAALLSELEAGLSSYTYLQHA